MANWKWKAPGLCGLTYAPEDENCPCRIVLGYEDKISFRPAALCYIGNRLIYVESFSNLKEAKHWVLTQGKETFIATLQKEIDTYQSALNILTNSTEEDTENEGD